jgi:flagellar biosynthetic protein FliQ
MESDYRLSGEKLLYLTNMTPETVVTIGQQAVEMTLMISAPLLLTALAVGLIVSIFQAATQINEMTLSFIPKLLGIFVVLIFTGPWMVNTMVDYIQRLFSNIPWMIG